MAGLGETLAGLWDSFKGSPVGKFVQYEVAPESTMAPNERVRPGLYQGYQYQLRPGETFDDAGTVYGADGNPVTFKDGPQAMGLADMFGLMTGGVAGGAPKGAITSGFHRVHREVNPAITHDIDYARDWLANRLQAGHKRGAQGYRLPDLDDVSLEKMDKALTSMSGAPGKVYLDKADRALSMGFDTPGYHFTNMEPDPEIMKRLGATPFREIDPFYGTRGSMYFGDVPSKIIQSGAAQKTYGDPRMYPYVLRDVMGEHALPPGTAAALPETLKLNQWGQVTDQSFNDLRAGLQSAPGYADNIGAAREAEKKFMMEQGLGFNQGFFDQAQASASKDLAPMIQKLYYDKVPGEPNTVRLMAPEDFVPATTHDDGLPHYSQFEVGARMNRNGQAFTGVHSPLQNEIGAIGFSGSRVLDEMRNKGGKSFAMIDPAGVRSMGAKFQDPYGDLLSARVPATWMNGLFAPQLPDTER